MAREAPSPSSPAAGRGRSGPSASRRPAGSDLDQLPSGAEVAYDGPADAALTAPGLVDVAADREPRPLLLNRREQRWAAEMVPVPTRVAVAPWRGVQDEDRLLGARGQHLRCRLVVEVKAPIPWRDGDAGTEAEELDAVDRRPFAVQDSGRLPARGGLAQRRVGLVVAGDEHGRLLDRRERLDCLAQPLGHRGEVAAADHCVRLP